MYDNPNVKWFVLLCVVAILAVSILVLVKVKKGCGGSGKNSSKMSMSTLGNSECSITCAVMGGVNKVYGDCMANPDNEIRRLNTGQSLKEYCCQFTNKVCGCKGPGCP